MPTHEPCSRGSCMIPGGYILLSRQLLGSDVWTGPPGDVKLWLYLLLKANHAPRKDGNRLSRGQCHVTLEELQDVLSYRAGYRAIRPKRDHVWRALQRLRKGYAKTGDIRFRQSRCAREDDGEGQMITTTKTTRGLVVTICNYDRYQTPANYERDSEADDAATTNATTPRHDRQECKNDKKQKPCRKRPEDNGNGRILKHKADALIALYKMVVEPPTKDDSPARGRKNAASYMREGLCFSDLSAAVVNYGETVAIEGRERAYRKRCGNFFGRQERFFEDYLPDEYHKPDPPDDDDDDDDELSRRNWEQMQKETA